MEHGVFKVALARDSTDQISDYLACAVKTLTLFGTTRFELNRVARKTASWVIGKKASDSHIGGGCLAVSRTGVGNSGVEYWKSSSYE